MTDNFIVDCVLVIIYTFASWIVLGVVTLFTVFICRKISSKLKSPRKKNTIIDDWLKDNKDDDDFPNFPNANPSMTLR